ncbi:MAG: hypothetical protein KGI78_03735 [Patescibacteria group bacterium]|nr:hypothetical protein [Patescibacteria group bacterium]MDE1943999.1 hypothetical protein [Patescibacteria group bacterium]MDE1945069.1 hypothetical protein [Patescibacteria group bacterium]MDE2057937.1 hypothetical protein [Patescibacteria group bacterium]
MREQFAKTLADLGADERLAVLIGDISHFLLRDFEQEFPERFYNMGIAEQSMLGVAAGLAMRGFYPVVHSIAPFVVERCFEQIKDDLCYQGLGVNIVSVGSAFDYAALGCTHHCYDDLAILRALPGMQIVYPSAPHEFDSLFRATYANGSPTYFRLPAKTHEVRTSPRFGEVELLREGGDCTIVVAGPQLPNALAAADALAEEGVACDVIYLTTIKPLAASARAAITASVQKTGKVVSVEEHSIIGGVGDEVARICTDVPFTARRVGIADRFLTNYGSYAEHCAANGLTAEGIIAAAHELA